MKEIEVKVKQKRIVTESYETVLQVPDDFDKENYDFPKDWVNQIVHVSKRKSRYYYTIIGEEVDEIEITIK